MADAALCGPSNALSAFQKHSQADRSLQQDRLITSRHHQFNPDQSFRSFDLRAGSLDAQFHAFENGVAGPAAHFDNGLFLANHAFASYPGSQAQAQPLQYHHQQQQQQQPAAWAADFSRLQIVDPQPVPVQRFRSEAPLVRSVNGDWQGEFMRHREGQGQQQQQMSSEAQGKQNILTGQMPLYETDGFMQYQQQQQPMMDPIQFQQGISTSMQGQQVEESVQAEDWSRAFEDAFKDVLAEEQVSHVEHMESQMMDVREEVDKSEPLPMEQEETRIGSDAIHYTEVKDRTAETDATEANALARVAGELLHNVQGDSSAKFQNSQFLDLMRKIRDRQVEVRDNDFHSTAEGGYSISAVNRTDQSSSVQSEVEHTSQNNQDSFQFPDLNNVYQPDPDDVLDFGMDSDQYFAPAGGRAESQIQDLHPGGRLYPARTGSGSAQMSGGISSFLGDGSNQSA